MVNKWPLLLVFLLLFASASAADLTINYKPLKDTVAYNEAAKYTVSITNNQDKADSICITTPTWGTAAVSDPILNLAAHSTGTVSLSMTPPSDVYIGKYAIEFAAKSCYKYEITDTALLRITVTSELPHVEPSLDLPTGLRPHEYTMNIIAKNIGSEKVDGLRGTVSSDLFESQAFNIGSIDAQEARVALQTKVNINPKASIGFHNVIISIYQGDKIIKQSFKRVEILSDENVAVAKSMANKIIAKTYEFTLTNKGNLAVEDFYSVSLPAWEKLFVSTSPKASVSKSGSQAKFTWVYSLQPGESTTIKYTFSYLPVIVLLVIFAAIALVMAGQYQKEFEIKKTVVKEGSNLRVKVSIKNISSNHITGVTVSDFVPMPLKLVKDFGTLNPTAIKRERGAMRVVWKFDAVYPNEERLLVYGLKTTLGFVGEATLPAAELKFKTKEGRQKAYSSNTAAIKGKVSVGE